MPSSLYKKILVSCMKHKNLYLGLLRYLVDDSAHYKVSLLWVSLHQVSLYWVLLYRVSWRLWSWLSLFCHKLTSHVRKVKKKVLQNRHIKIRSRTNVTKLFFAFFTLSVKSLTQSGSLSSIFERRSMNKCTGKALPCSLIVYCATLSHKNGIKHNIFCDKLVFLTSP